MPVRGVPALLVSAVSRSLSKRLGWGRQLWIVWMHSDVKRHIEVRRGMDSASVLRTLDAVISSPALVGFERSGRQRLLFIGPEDAGQLYAVAVKVVEPSSDARVLWVSTAFPVSRRSLRRLARRHSLFAVV